MDRLYIYYSVQVRGPKNGVHPLPKLPRSLPMHDPDPQDAPLPALGQIFRHQVADFPGLEQVQVERAGYGPGSGIGGWVHISMRHQISGNVINFS